MATETNQWQSEVRRLLGLIVREPHRLPELPVVDQDLTLRLARRAKLLGRVAYSLDAAGLLDALPAVARDQLTSAMVMVQARQRMAFWELDRIAWAVGSEDRPVLIAMKGCAYLVLDLPNCRGRVFADVDIMTEHHDVGTVEALLNDKGWITASLTPYDDNYYRRWTHEIPPMTHRSRQIEVDLHHNILPWTARLKPDGRKLVERSQTVAGSRYRVLANEDMVLHAMTHLMFADDLADKVRELVDIVDLVEHFSSDDPRFWSRFLTRAPELDLERAAFYGVRYAARLLSANIPDAVIAETAEWGPPRVIVALMDRLVPRALYPQHPDRRSKLTDLSRWLLYVRSHWIRMAPWRLFYHLTYKFLATRLGLGRGR